VVNRDSEEVSVIDTAAGDIDRLPALAKELVGNHPDVLVAETTPAVAALLAETRSIPIIFEGVTDPVASGSSRA